jgi:hypothetical protein
LVSQRLLRQQKTFCIGAPSWESMNQESLGSCALPDSRLHGVDLLNVTIFFFFTFVGCAPPHTPALLPSPSLLSPTWSYLPQSTFCLLSPLICLSPSKYYYNCCVIRQCSLKVSFKNHKKSSVDFLWFWLAHSTGTVASPDWSWQKSRSELEV